MGKQVEPDARSRSANAIHRRSGVIGPRQMTIILLQSGSVRPAVGLAFIKVALNAHRIASCAAVIA
jgi:hypothetical protein